MAKDIREIIQDEINWIESVNLLKGKRFVPKRIVLSRKIKEQIKQELLNSIPIEVTTNEDKYQNIFKVESYEEERYYFTIQSTVREV